MTNSYLLIQQLRKVALQIVTYLYNKLRKVALQIVTYLYNRQIRRNGFCNYRIFTKYFLIKYFELLSYNKCKQIKIHQRRFKLVYACRRHTVPPVYASMLKSIHCGAAIRLRHAFLWDIDMGCMR